MKTEHELRRMIAALKSTLKHSPEAGTIDALGALLWAVGDYASWTEAYKAACEIAGEG